LGNERSRSPKVARSDCVSVIEVGADGFRPGETAACSPRPSTTAFLTVSLLARTPAPRRTLTIVRPLTKPIEKT
jgi:hypothetical protein